jgi:hypothetical protein
MIVATRSRSVVASPSNGFTSRQGPADAEQRQADAEPAVVAAAASTIDVGMSGGTDSQP